MTRTTSDTTPAVPMDGGREAIDAILRRHLMATLTKDERDDIAKEIASLTPSSVDAGAGLRTVECRYCSHPDKQCHAIEESEHCREMADQREVDRILGLSDEDIRAEIVAEGRDPEALAEAMRGQMGATFKMVEEIKHWKEEARSWRTVAERLETEKQAAQQDAVAWHVDYKAERRTKNAALSALTPSSADAGAGLREALQASIREAAQRFEALAVEQFAFSSEADDCNSPKLADECRREGRTYRRCSEELLRLVEPAPAISAPQAETAVPDGWVLLPKNPPRDLFCAWMGFVRGASVPAPAYEKMLRLYYGRMVDAAPEICPPPALSAPPAQAETTKMSRVEVPFAYCCNMDPATCDCVNPNHGTAWINVRSPAQAETAGEEHLASYWRKKWCDLMAAYDALAAHRHAAQAGAGEDAPWSVASGFPHTAESSAGWMDTAAQFSRNADFYRDLIIQIGEMFGDAAKTSDDGSVQQDVLALRVPELVAKALAAHRHAAQAGAGDGPSVPVTHEEIGDIVLQFMRDWRTIGMTPDQCANALASRLESIIQTEDGELVRPAPAAPIGTGNGEASGS